MQKSKSYFSWFSSPENLNGLTENMPKEDKMIQLSEGNTRYNLEGNINGKKVILIHGISQPKDVFVYLKRDLISNGFYVLSYDLYGRGFSASSNKPQSLDILVDQLYQLIDKIFNISILGKELNLYGWSLGSIIASSFGNKYSELVSKIILLSPIGNNISKPFIYRIVTLPFIGQIIMNLIGRKELITMYQNEFEFLTMILKDPDLTNLLNFLIEHAYNNPALLRTILSNLKNIPEIDDNNKIYNELNQKDIKILILSGSDDPLVKNPENLKKILTKSELKIINNAGHSCGISHYKKINDFTCNFFKLNLES